MPEQHLVQDTKKIRRQFSKDSCQSNVNSDEIEARQKKNHLIDSEAWVKKAETTDAS